MSESLRLDGSKIVRHVAFGWNNIGKQFSFRSAGKKFYGVESDSRGGEPSVDVRGVEPRCVRTGGDVRNQSESLRETMSSSP